MVARMTLISFVLFICCFCRYGSNLELDSTMLHAMDEYTLTMEKERATFNFSKEIDVRKAPSFSEFAAVAKSKKEVRLLVEKPEHDLRDFHVPMVGYSRPDVRYEEISPLHVDPSIAEKPKIDFKEWLNNLTKGATKKKEGRIPLNKNLQAMNQIQNGMLEAGAMNTSLNESEILQQILKASFAKQYNFARQLVGHCIYNWRKGAKQSTKEILARFKKQLGEERYNELMAYDGGVTLAFALDTTGSMGDDIDAAKEIVFGIVTQERAFSVDYILSPFNDPVTHRYHGPVTHMDKTEKFKFLKLITEVDAQGGGDCDELAITGIKNIFASPLQYRSPIYVITDAGAKDATEENIEMLKEMILHYKTPINFYLSNAGCLTNDAIQVYKSLARFSGGQILYFSNKKEIASTTEFIQKGLIGGCFLPVGFDSATLEKTRETRSIENRFSFLVDDSIDLLSTAVMDKADGEVQLYNPAGILQVKGKLDTGKGAVFLVEKPTPGLWRLKCPSCTSESLVTSNGISLENIDFDYNFLVDVGINEKTKVISSSYPIKGKNATVVITVPAHAKTQPSSLKINVVDKQLRTIYTAKLEQYGRAPGRFKGSFPTPSHEFSLILKGKTKKNKDFERLSNGIIQPNSALIHVFAAPDGFSVKAGTTTSLKFGLHCYSGKEKFEVKVSELDRVSIRKPKGLYCIPNQMALFTIAFKANGSAKAGDMHNAVVTVKSKRSGDKASKHVQLLIV